MRNLGSGLVRLSVIVAMGKNREKMVSPGDGLVYAHPHS